MTDQRDKATARSADRVAEQALAAEPAGISRRTLLRGAYVAVPTILTLNSGVAAAWARSSNVLSGVRQGAPAGDKLCVDVSPFDEVPGRTLSYDLGARPDFDVVRIPSPSLIYRDKSLPGKPIVSAETVCVKSSTYQYKPANGGKWEDLKKNTRKPSIMVSATALHSFAGRYAECDIRNL